MGKQKQPKWTLPEDFADYFDPSSDDEFKKAHPVGYFFLVTLGITLLLAPAVLFLVLAPGNSPWVLVGMLGGFVFGIGLFNYVAVIIGQYLGRHVSNIAFLVGGIIMLVSWFLC